MIAGDQVPYDLLDDVKNHLDITWEDDALDRKITELIAAGEIYIDSKLGERGNYLEAGPVPCYLSTPDMPETVPWISLKTTMRICF